MTVTVQEAASGPYFPNGVTTQFPFDFKAAAGDEIAVVLVADDGTFAPFPDGSFSVALAVDNEGGTVTMAAAPVNDGRALFVVSSPSFAQEILFEDEGPFNSAVLNPVADRSAIRDIWLRDQVLRSIRVPFGEVGPLLPRASARAGKVLSFDGDGNPIALTVGSAQLALQAQRRELVAVAGQTQFAFAASALSGFVSVFLNGVKLPASDFLHNGALVTLGQGCEEGDTVAIEGFASAIALSATLTSYKLRTVAEKLDDVVSLLDVIPPGLHAAIRSRTSTVDVSGWVQAALDYLSLIGGGELWVPPGKYRLGSTINIPPFVTIRGASNGWVPFFFPTNPATAWGSWFEVTHAGHGFRSTFAINAFTPAHITLDMIGIVCTAGNASTGGGFYDQGGSYIKVRRCFVYGFKYGVIFDQTEQSDILDTHFLESRHSSIWLVRGPDMNAAHTNGQWTNRIVVARCEFNQPGQWCILDDGGLVHAFENNNYNGGGAGHIRIAGFYTTVNIIGGEWEGAGGPSVLLATSTLSGKFPGEKAQQVVIVGGHFGMPTPQPAVRILGVGSLTLIGVLFDGTVPAVVGLNNADVVNESGCTLGIGGGTLALFDATRSPSFSSQSRRFRFAQAYTLPILGNASQTQAFFANAGVAAGDFVSVTFEPTAPGVTPLAIGTPIAEAGGVRVTFQNLTGAGAGGGAGTISFDVVKK